MKILFCGLGGIGQRHLRNLSSLLGDDIEVHAYRVRKQNFKLLNDMTIEKNSNVENDYRITTHDSLEAALSTKLDLVMVCNPSSLHIPIAIKATQAGAHVFLEKPVSNNLDGITELQKVLSEKKLICYVGYNLRFHPAIKKMKSLVEDGFFGNILGCAVEVGEYLPGWHKYEDYRQMYASKSDLGGGVILSQIHEMDLIYWFFGLPKSILTVGGKYSNLEIDVEDTAHSLIQIDSKFGKFPVTLLQDFIQRPPTRTFKIVGDKGIVKVDLILNTFQKQC
jgi:predicted dehydrogenase